MLIIMILITSLLITILVYTMLYHMLYYDFYSWYVKKYPWRLVSIRYLYEVVQSLLQLTVKVRKIGSIFETKESFHDKIENKKMQIYKSRLLMIGTIYVCCISIFYLFFHIKDWLLSIWILAQGITKEEIINTVTIIAKGIQQYTPIVTTLTFIIIIIFTYNYNKARYKFKNTIYAEDTMKSLYKKIVKIRRLIVCIIIKIEDNLGQFYLTKEYTEQNSDLISIVVREYIKEKYDHGKENNYEIILLNAFQEIEEKKMLEETVRGIKEYQQDILRHLELGQLLILPSDITRQYIIDFMRGYRYDRASREEAQEDIRSILMNYYKNLLENLFNLRNEYKDIQKLISYQVHKDNRKEVMEKFKG